MNRGFTVDCQKKDGSVHFNEEDSRVTSSLRPRRGRPRAENAGEVDRRILDAATALILEHGYGRTTMEQVADAARAGKTTLYSRYPTKADLFAAVVARSGEAFESLEASLPERVGTRRDRLVRAGLELADLTLTQSSIALMRATSAEADTFPEVAREGFSIGFEACSRHIARALATDPSTEAVDEAMPLARRFVELAFHPLYVHAFFGADLDHLRQRAEGAVEEVALRLVG